MNDDCKYRYDTTNGQAAGIAHKYLGGKSIVPKETDQCADEGADKDYQSSLPGMYMILRYPAYSMWLDTYANMPKVRPMIAEFPAAIPSIPSFRLAPLDTAVTTKMVTNTKIIQPTAWALSPRKPTKSA